MVEATNPDVVCIEYAVNDSTTEFYAKTGEALIRRLRTNLPNARIVFIAFTRVGNNLVNDATNLNQVLHDRWKALCVAYGVTFVSFADRLYQVINVDGGTLADYLSDTVHPTAAGHALAATVLEPAMVSALLGTGMPAMPDRVNACENFEYAPTIRNGTDNDGETGTWSTSGTARLSSVAGSMITWTATCASFGIHHTSSGVIRWRVDGGAWSADMNLSSYGAGRELSNTERTRASYTVDIEVVSGTVTLNRFLAV